MAVVRQYITAAADDIAEFLGAGSNGNRVNLVSFLERPFVRVPTMSALQEAAQHGH